MNSKIFEMPSLWNRIGGDMHLLREMVTIFAAEYPPLLSKVEAAIERGDAAKVESVGHKLKGSLLQFSALSAAETSARLESMGKNQSLEGAGAVVAGLRGQIEEVLQALNQMVAQGPPNHQ